MMLDEPAIRKQLQEVQDTLRKLEAEREALLTVHRGLEAWLRLHSPNGSDSVLAPFTVVPNLIHSQDGTLPQEPDKRISLRAAVLKVVRDARGEPLHVNEIWTRAQALGATTGADRPISAVDFALHGLSKRNPVERAGRGRWRWSNVEVEVGGRLVEIAMPKRLK